jgi:hypothetical protein
VSLAPSALLAANSMPLVPWFPGIGATKQAAPIAKSGITRNNTNVAATAATAAIQTMAGSVMSIDCHFSGNEGHA